VLADRFAIGECLPIITRNVAESEPGKIYRITIYLDVATEITTEDYRALAELRYRIRHFLHEGDGVARAAGLEPQQYVVLTACRSWTARRANFLAWFR
jgi:hypothetical protein